MMGVSIVLSQRSLRSKNIQKRNILLKICRRTIILFVLGFTGQDDITKLENLRIFGVLQRLASCYFFTAIIVLIFDKKNDQRDTTQSSTNILGILTGILLCYLGVQAGHCFIYSTRVLRICGHWLVLGIICGSIALILSRGGHSNSLIPINKNLWSLTFVLMLASLAFIILTILYFLIDVNQ
ncbi:unnamed protein product [Rotaria sp. Silwood2]|nr:unnamed protein product [Rotaria sp. Silwood2]